MDVVVIDVSDAWGMLLSQKWVVDLGGSIQMDLYYAIIPTYEGTFVTLHREPMRRYHVEDPQDPENELVFYEYGFGSYTVLVIEVYPQEDIKNMWKMNFDGAKSQSIWVYVFYSLIPRIHYFMLLFSFGI
jgi:hypothetical protein